LAGGLSRGSIVSAVAPREFGKPRPSLIVQTDLLNPVHPTVAVCLLTTDLVDAPRFRVSISPSPQNGLRLPSQVMVDKIFALQRDKIGDVLGHLSESDMTLIDSALGYVLGLAVR
jgi:mRNA interferase MazF